MMVMMKQMVLILWLVVTGMIGQIMMFLHNQSLKGNPHDTEHVGEVVGIIFGCDMFGTLCK
jgi:hypothetical protein